MSACSQSHSGRSLLTLYRLPLSYRMLYTGILFFLCIGYAGGLAQQDLRAGLTPKGTADWILGNAEDTGASRMLFPKSGAEVLDEIWRRTMGDILPTVMVLALLFRSDVTRKIRNALMGAIVFFAVADVLGPGLILFFGRSLGVIWWTAQVGQTLAAFLAAFICWSEMWLRRSAGPRIRGQGIGR